MNPSDCQDICKEIDSDSHQKVIYSHKNNKGNTYNE